MKIDMAKKAWQTRVGNVFYTMPRNGNSKDIVWLARKSIENVFLGHLSSPGVSICVDGATGTGKSSLAITGLDKENYQYIQIQITREMTWLAFCREFANFISQKASKEYRAEGGFTGPVPHAKFEVTSLPEKTNLSSWTEHDICRHLSNKNAVLFIDDAERANEGLINRIADMCKLVTQSYTNSQTKLLIVGTDDIYRRLHKANSSLEGRLKEISVGTFAHPEDSWKFIQLGLEKLGLRHPANDKFAEPDEAKESMRYVYEAADGLPKSLNELGREIASQAFQRNRVSIRDIKLISEDVPLRWFNNNRRQFKNVIGVIEKSDIARSVVWYMYKEGIGQVHYLDDVIYGIFEDAKDKESGFVEESIEENIREAINSLVEMKFITQTGQNNEILYAKDPTAAHIFGLAIKTPKKYGIEFKGELLGVQLEFPWDFG